MPPTNEANQSRFQDIEENAKTIRIRRKSAVALLQYSKICPFRWSRNVFMCFYCDNSYTDIDELKKHNIKEHNSPTVADIRKSLLKLKTYELIKVNIADVNCKICDEVITDFDNLKAHLKIRHDKRIQVDQDGVLPFRLIGDEYNCVVCNQQFSQYKSLNQHMNLHFQNFICEQCGSGFISPDRLRRHVLIHGSKTFPCETCDKVFTHAEAVKKHHAIVHMKAKTSRCPHCSQTFSNLYQKKKHVANVHGLKVQEFQCDLCPKTFLLSGHLTEHKLRVHINLKRYTCKVCDLKFLYEYKLRNHMVCHGDIEKIHQCAICKKSFARNYTLKNHMRTHNKDKKN